MVFGAPTRSTGAVSVSSFNSEPPRCRGTGPYFLLSFGLWQLWNWSLSIRYKCDKDLFQTRQSMVAFASLSIIYPASLPMRIVVIWYCFENYKLLR
jgi:hypothetical protein